MRLLVLAVGRLKSGPEADLARHYLAGLNSVGSGVGFSEVSILEVDERKGPKSPGAKDWQAHRLIERLPARAKVVALDERGQSLSSRDFARWLEAWRDAGIREAAFLLGGADGHGKAVLSRADRTLSLGPMTWPHHLARVLLLEQLYRAATILARHPYHHG